MDEKPAVKGKPAAKKVESEEEDDEDYDEEDDDEEEEEEDEDEEEEEVLESESEDEFSPPDEGVSVIVLPSNFWNWMFLFCVSKLIFEWEVVLICFIVWYIKTNI